MDIDLTGTEILGYRIVERLGEGGMATVWRARHPDDGREMALKVLDPALARDSGIVERFAREAVLQARLQHPGIAQVEDFCLDPLAMLVELVPGRPLDEVLASEGGRLPLARALPMLRQVLAAVEHAHGKRVVHRDLKPDNVMVRPDGSVKVMDFGIAKGLWCTNPEEAAGGRRRLVDQASGRD